ncbi:phospholipase D family protein [Vibrio sp. RE86]|uniref:phospholipase D family protein n=1 Tax=Vibrio sp. RE86 TaxID=2607605 RepID=UPI00149333EA|nr:phospholipase D family protein [Vibrio sp. RE86]NOH81465.1 phospholipase D family protein [Vibrio sp. RE86]
MPTLNRITSSVLLIASLAGCSSLPESISHDSDPQKAVPESTLLSLSESYLSNTEVPDQSGVLIQDSGWQALSQRLALVDSAEHSIDIQYYIWNSDKSGHYLASRLLAAADRGVSVRVLLDDINLNQREDLLTALDTHPNVQIRVFNPTPTRRGLGKWFEFLGDFSRLNRRMHNKSFTVDGAFSVVGGRNIGDEYFDLSDEINFRDRDALVTGEVVGEIQTSFVGYWDSPWSYPVEMLGGEATSESPTLPKIATPVYLGFPNLPKGAKSSRQFMKDRLSEMSLVKADYISDTPVPDDVSNTDEPKITAQALGKLARESQNQVLLESAYLVFDDEQLKGWQALRESGVEIRALTNSMASNDLVTNHSAYAGRRKDMLEHGISLFELMPDTKLCNESTKDDSKCAPKVPYGLHTKSAVFDSKIAAIGSFNFNLRSTYLNTESLLIIESEKVAQQLTEHITPALKEANSWNLILDDGNVVWYANDKVWEKEPETGNWERMQSGFLQLLPIEKYL